MAMIGNRLRKIFSPGEMGKYLIAGIAAFATDAATLAVCVEMLGWHYLVGNTFGFAMGLLVSYYLNIKWVFAERRYEKEQPHEIVLFLLIVIVGYGVVQTVMWVMVDVFAQPLTIAKVVASMFGTAWNFTAKKILLFMR